MTERSNRILIAVFVLLLTAVFLMNLFAPDRPFSDNENRNLQTFPAFSIPSLLRGNFTQKTEQYCADQFIGRDRWIALKARLELLQGKKENNGVFLCADGRLLETFRAPESAFLNRQIENVNTLCANTTIPVTLALIPSAAEFYSDLLPNGVSNDSQRTVIDTVYAHTNAATADILSVLQTHSDEYIYYRTDHHWTSLGAYYGCYALADPLGFEAKLSTDYSVRTVSESFRGTTWSSSGFFWVAPDSMQTLVEEPDQLRVERFEAETPVQGSLYVQEMLLTKDKYRFFLGGNVPRAVITTENLSCPSLLILRDSYADSMIPFLLDHYAQIHLLDLRYYRGSVADYIKENEIDDILLLYSLDTFCTDISLGLMTR